MSDKILAKVKNLLELSSNNSSVNEAAAAYKAAQKLLSEHRLSMADVELFSDSDEEEIEESKDALYVGKRAITWKGILARGIANCNGCDVFWSSDWCVASNSMKKRLTVVGRKSDITIVQWLFHSVSFQIEIFSKSALVANGGGGKTFSNNFKKGATSSVLSRLREAKKEVEQEYEGTKAMVLVSRKDEDVARYMSSLPLRGGKAYSRYDSAGYSAGVAAGKRVNITGGSIGSGSSGTKGLLG
jgi:hypothetical protein